MNEEYINSFNLLNSSRHIIYDITYIGIANIFEINYYTFSFRVYNIGMRCLANKTSNTPAVSGLYCPKKTCYIIYS